MLSLIDGTQTFDSSKISYSDPKANPKGGKVVNMYNKEARESLCISTPMMLTWGAQECKDGQGNPTGKFTMALQFPTSDYSNDDLDAYLTFMKDLEKSVKSVAKENSKKWFGKDIQSDEVMDEKFNVMLRHPRVKDNISELDYSRPPTLTAKLPCWRDVWQSEIYDERGEPLCLKSMPSTTPLEFLLPKTHVMCILQCGGLWFVNGKVSITWNLKQAVVKRPAEVVEGQCFLQIKQADKEKFDNLPEVQAKVETNDVNLTIVEDSDNEDDNITPEDITDGYSAAQIKPDVENEGEGEDEGKEDEPEEETKPVVKKKAVVKKKIVKK